MQKRICIDPGHGGKDPGAIKGNRHEADDTLRLALAVRSKLIAQDIGVLMARTTDTYVDLNARCEAANDLNCDYYLSLHRNSGSTSSTGVETWIHSKSVDRVKRYGKLINDAAVNATGLKNRGVKLGTPAAKSYTDFGVNRLTDMPSALVEIGFISNDRDNAAFDKNLDKLATALTKALCEIVGVNYKAPTAPTPKPEQKPEQPKPSAEIKPDDIVIVNGTGTAGSSGAGKKSREYKNQKMRVVKIADGAAYPYACSLILKKGDKAVTAWFKASQIKAV